jgi:hypothetical protein
VVTLTEASVVSILTFLVGLIVGHRFALLRDKRKEFNDSAAPLRAWALALQDPSHFPPPKPGKVEIDRFHQYLSTGKKRQFNSLVHEYDSAVAQATRLDALNSTYYEDLSALVDIGRSLMQVTRLR